MRRGGRTVGLLRAVGIGCLLATLVAVSTQPAAAQPARSRIDALVRDAVAKQGIKAAIVEVTAAGRPVITKAYGKSQTGVPATTRMHFRGGAVATAHMSTLLLRLADRGRVDLDDKLSKWLLRLPGARRVTLRMLAAMTAGYSDYASDPRLTQMRYANPFRAITNRHKLRLALDRPLQFTPGSNWSYSHTNYVILGLALERITGRPLDVALRRMVLRPLRLRNTTASDTAAIPRPVLHAYSAERRPFLGVPRSTRFLEDSTFWNPQWTLARGAVQTTTIRDLTRTAIGIGTGRLLTRRSHRLQIASHTGFGHPQPGCDRCTRLSRRYGYGLGVIRTGPWILQRSLLNGYAATASYHPAKRISIALATTFRASSHDTHGNLNTTWRELHTKICRTLTRRR